MSGVLYGNRRNRDGWSGQEKLPRIGVPAGRETRKRNTSLQRRRYDVCGGPRYRERQNPRYTPQTPSFTSPKHIQGHYRKGEKNFDFDCQYSRDIPLAARPVSRRRF